MVNGALRRAWAARLRILQFGEDATAFCSLFQEVEFCWTSVRQSDDEMPKSV
jgi:hypothetical protein